MVSKQIYTQFDCATKNQLVKYEQNGKLEKWLANDVALWKVNEMKCRFNRGLGLGAWRPISIRKPKKELTTKVPHQPMTYFEVVMHAYIISVKSKYFTENLSSNNSNNRAKINDAINERVSFD